jgi:hypothetical protein
MITLTRNQVRRLRVAFRRSALGITNRGLIPPLVLRAEGAQLRAQYQYRELAVEHVQPGSYRPIMALTVPLDALADCEGSGDSPVVLEAAALDRTVVRWDDRGIPQTREYDLINPVDRLEPIPGLPTAWSTNPAQLLAALAEATETGDPGSPRYDLGCIQLHGTRGQIVATDGRQALSRSGFHFPGDDALLMKGRPIFGCRALPRDQPVEVGRNDTHVIFRMGDWTIWTEIQKEARFPDVERVIPGDAEIATRLRLDPDDAGFLDVALGRLPGADENNSPVTIDLNGVVSLRASAGEQPHQVTELVLSRSSYTGPPVCICVNRTFLDRALRLGFTEVGFSGIESPLICRDQHTIYAVQPLTGGTPLGPDDSVTRIESLPVASRGDRLQARSETTRRGMNESARRNRREPARVAASNGRAPASPVGTNGREPAQPAARNGHGRIKAAEINGTSSNEPTGTTLAALIQEAEALHTALGEAKSRTARLIAGLRRHRKHSRLVQETLKSLRQLKLVEAAE